MIHQLKRLPVWILFVVIAVPVALVAMVVHVVRTSWIVGTERTGSVMTWLIRPAPPKPIKIGGLKGTTREHHQQTPW